MTNIYLTKYCNSLSSYFSHPIADDNLQDFHEHRLAEGSSPFEVNYNLYSMVCHSGVLAGGHYVSYGKMGNGKWYCQNDSACKVGNLFK